MDKESVNKQFIRKITKAKYIITDIMNLTIEGKDGYIPKGYGNQELNKAANAMSRYIKEIETIKYFINN